MKTNIRKIIESKGLTVPQVAVMCGLPLSTVSAHYYGQRKNMGVKAALRYVEGLGCTIHEIMGAK